tara:strand:- start:132 stop:518 length:387 start_codon:yes stop_codon:yes gene_type:complete
MAKRRLTHIAEELGMDFEKAKDLVFDKLSEEMITGKGKNTWINDIGQEILDDLSPMPIRYRGKVLGNAQNPNFVIAYIREIPMKVPVRIPYLMRGRLTGKFIYIDSINEDDIITYHYAKPPSIYERQK